VRRGRPLVHVRLQLVKERRRCRHTLMRPPRIDETENYWQLTICNGK
jgi:hypothetical protein